MEVKCPECCEEIIIDISEMDSGDVDFFGCSKCLKTFQAEVEYMPYVTTHKTPCQNDGGNCEYKPYICAPIEFSMMKCIYCDETRTPTTIEFDEIMKKIIK